MKRYRVIFEESAQENVRECFDWGCRAWGKRTAPAVGSRTAQRGRKTARRCA